MADPFPTELVERSIPGVPERPIPAQLREARDAVLEAAATLAGIPDAALVLPWAWIGGPEAAELRYGLYRIGEAFERARLDAAAASRASDAAPGRAAELIAPATAARWELEGLLLPLPAGAWDADPGGGEWTVRRTLGHVIGTQRGYAVGTGWWVERAVPASDVDLPTIPEALYEALPDDEAEGEGTPGDVRARLGSVVDRACERLAGLAPEALALRARWDGFPVDVAFRLGRWASHLREHTIQVEKTLAMLDHRPTEVDRLVRLVLAAWGRAEASVYGAPEAGASAGLAVLASAAAAARSVATEIAGIAGG